MSGTVRMLEPRVVTVSYSTLSIVRGVPMRGLVLLCGLLLVPAVAAAQSDAALIAEATLPLPNQLKDGATVVVTDGDGNRRVVRQGTNALVCSPDGPAPGFSVNCSDESIRRSGDVPKAATVAPGAPVPRGYLGWVLGLAEKMEEADAILEDLERRRDRGYFSAWLLAHVHLGLGQNNEAITWLEKAVEEHDGILSYANLLYTLDSLRSDPRLQSLLKKMNFPSASAEGPSSSA